MCVPLLSRSSGSWSSLAAPPNTACRVQVEGIALDEDSLTYLGEIGEETSLRHAVQVGAPLAVRCR